MIKLRVQFSWDLHELSNKNCTFRDYFPETMLCLCTDYDIWHYLCQDISFLYFVALQQNSFSLVYFELNNKEFIFS